MSLRDALCILLSLLMLGGSAPSLAAQGQSTPPPATPTTPAPAASAEAAQAPQAGGTMLSNPYRRLKIVVLRGRNGVNVPGGIAISTPAVEVRDANDRLIEGATVTFEVPATGPSARFPGEKTSLTTRTDTAGQAIADGFEPNAELGRFVVKVSARYEGVIAVVELSQRNVAPNSAEAASGESGGKRGLFSGKRKYLWLGAAGAGVAVAILLTRNGSSSATSVSVSPGPVVIGGR